MKLLSYNVCTLPNMSGFYLHDKDFKVSIYCQGEEKINFLYPSIISSVEFKSLKDGKVIDLPVEPLLCQYTSFYVKNKRHISLNKGSSNFVIDKPGSYTCPNDWKILTTMGYKDIENIDYYSYLFPSLPCTYEDGKSNLLYVIMFFIILLLWQIYT